MKPKKGLASIVESLIRPTPVPMSRSEFHKSLSRTSGLFRENLKPQPSNTFFKDHHHTQIPMLLTNLSTDSTTSMFNSLDENYDNFRVKLSSARNPMTLYARLRSSGEVTREACHALLFNPNLTSLSQIKQIATESCIPASYVVAKLLKLDLTLNEINPWYKKVPSITGLKEYICELDHMQDWRRRRNPESIDDWRRSIQQLQMDVTAHLSYSLLKSGITSAYDVWRGFCVDAGVSHATRVAVTKLPSLWLLKQALKSGEEVKGDIIAAVLEWDDGVIGISQESTQRTLTMEIIKTLASESLNNAEYLWKATRVMSLSKEILDPEDIVECSDMIAKSWQRWDSPCEVAKRIEFLGWAVKNSSGAGLLGRARLERLKAALEARESGKATLSGKEVFV